MKFLAIVFLISFLLVGLFFFINKDKGERKNKISSTKENIQINSTKKETYIIVPYWSLPNNLETLEFDKFMYFGVEASEEGINKNDPGFKNIEKFKGLSKNKKTYLIIRMLDNDLNNKVLENNSLQEKIINNTIKTAKENNFSGIALDLEIQGLPFENFVNSISGFNSKFYRASKSTGLEFGTFLYADSYFRIRPFDIKKIGEKADRIFIMAYDFSKARGNPGPNFPLDNEEKYGYSFKKMINDFLSEINKEKITIIFGMFGYDWEVDDKERGVKLATPKSTLEFEKFLSQCVSSNTCTVDNNINGKKIQYKNVDENHLIWFEDYNSVEKKIEFLMSKGMNSFGYWAYSYF